MSSYKVGQVWLVFLWLRTGQTQEVYDKEAQLFSDVVLGLSRTDTALVQDDFDMLFG